MNPAEWKKTKGGIKEIDAKRREEGGYWCPGIVLTSDEKKSYTVATTKKTFCSLTVRTG